MMKIAKATATAAKKNGWLLGAGFFLVVFLFALASCAVGDGFSTEGTYAVCYEANGGYIDGYPTRELRYRPGDLLAEPSTGAVNTGVLGRVSREGYTLAGWYTRETVQYEADERGDYIRLQAMYQRAADGDFVCIYQEDENGAYVLMKTTETDADGAANESESYLPFEPTKEEHKSLPRYRRAMVAYEKSVHQGLERYQFLTEDAYALLSSVFCEDYRGEYRYDEVAETYRYAPTQPGVRYALDVLYSATGDVTAQPRYTAHFSFDDADRWLFNEHRMGQGDITLYAAWQPALSVHYVYWDGSEFVAYAAGEGASLARPTGTAMDGNGRTFVAWSWRENEPDWVNFATAVYPPDTTDLYLYAYYIDGDYTRVTGKEKLEAIAANPAGNYVLCNDIDMDGTTGNPFGFGTDSVFTGRLEGMGFHISNFKITAVNKKNANAPVSYALFNNTEKATIRNLDATGTVTVSATSLFDINIALFVGEDRGGTTLSGCSGSLSVVNRSEKGAVLVGEVVAVQTQSTTLQNCHVAVESLPVSYRTRTANSKQQTANSK